LLRRPLRSALFPYTTLFRSLGVVAGLADRVLVMHGGELKEHGPVDDVFYRPRHAYTRSLLAAVPRLDSDRVARLATVTEDKVTRSEEHTSELQSRENLVCRL